MSYNTPESVDELSAPWNAPEIAWGEAPCVECGDVEEIREMFEQGGNTGSFLCRYCQPKCCEPGCGEPMMPGSQGGCEEHERVWALEEGE